MDGIRRWGPIALIILLLVEHFLYGGAWTTMAALSIFVLYDMFAPHEGLIGIVKLPQTDGFLTTQNVQWWYWTGHLETEDGRKFGFEVVFFAFRNYGLFWDQLAQGAITDVSRNKFHYSEFVHFGRPRRPKNCFDLKADSKGTLVAKGGDGKDRLHSEIDGYVLDLDLAQTKPPILHYGGGPHPYFFGGYTYYYSRVNMATSGTLTIDGVSHKVKGTSWFDRQYGDLLQAVMQGWQWFAIELDDNRQIMLYDLLGKNASVERAGSITDSAGRTRDLCDDDFKIDILGHWKSPNTGANYPSGWRVMVAGMTLTIEPMVLDQELCARHKLWVGPEYWEGACAVTGDATGKAYIELNGFTGTVIGAI